MTFLPWLRSRKSRRSRTSTRPTAPRHPLSLELLENRIQPSAYVVTTTADSGAGSLRDAITQVNADTSHVLYASPTDPTRDEIDFNIPGLSASTPGTITLGGAELLLTNSVIINGPGAGLLAVSGNGQSRVLEVAAGVTDTIAGLTIEAGAVSDANGGGILNNGDLTLSCCTISGNNSTGGTDFSGGDGGGIANFGTIAVNSCVVSSNSAVVNSFHGGNGGGIANFGTMTLSNSALSGDNAFGLFGHGGGGGAVFNVGMMTVSGCTLSGNLAKGSVIGSDGGGGGLLNDGTMTVSGCTLSANFGDGGGIRNAGTMTISTCTLSGNDGGGIRNSAAITICDSTVSGNTAGNGAGILNLAGQMTVSDSNIYANSAAAGGDGGGIKNNSGTVMVTRCTLIGNYAGYGAAISNISGQLTISDCTLSGNNASVDGSGGGIFNAGVNLTVTDCTISGNYGGYKGGGIADFGNVTVTGCTLSGNSAAEGGGIYNGIFNIVDTMTVEGCALSNNTANSAIARFPYGGDGGAIASYGTMTVSGCIVSGNTANVTGGGVYAALDNLRGDPAALTIQNASATDVFGMPTFDLNSAIFGNHAPSGADVENLGGLSIEHSAVSLLDNQNAGGTTINVAATDTATALFAFVPVAGQIVFKVQVLAAQAGAGTPTGTVTLYDSNNNALGTATLDANGQARFTVPASVASQPLCHAVYSGDGQFSGSTSAPPIREYFHIATNSSIMLVGNAPPPLTGSVNGIPFTSPFEYHTPFGDTVTVTLSTTATAGSPVGQYPITASLSGATEGNYFNVSVGTMYAVSLGGDPSSSGAQAVTFWDNKGNATTITAADLSSLDALNLVSQGGAAFDPHSVAQLQAWLSVSPNATTSYQLAVQLAVLDLNVLAGNVQATDLVYAGELLQYFSADQIAGLTNGGFIDVQDLMNAANAILGIDPKATTGDPNQAYEAALTQVLQAVNGNTDFVSQELLWGLVGLYPSLA